MSDRRQLIPTAVRARGGRRTIGAGLIAMVAAAASLVVAQAGVIAPGGGNVTAPQTIAGGTFEASGVVHVPDTTGVLFVDDGRNREIFWMELAADGRQQGPAVPVPLAADVTDLEGITSDGVSFYVVGSQSKKTGFDGDGLVRFRFDPKTRRTSAVERVEGLKAWLARQVPELAGAARATGDEALNIEAVAWDGRAGRLLLGLRAPVVEGKAIVIPLKAIDPAARFAIGNLRVDGAAIRLPLGGAGIRSLESDGAGLFHVISGADLNDEDRDFRIVEWNGDNDPASLRLVASFARGLKPEGITRANLGGRSVSLVVFDTSRFAVIEAPAKGR